METCFSSAGAERRSVERTPSAIIGLNSNPLRAEPTADKVPKALSSRGTFRPRRTLRLSELAMLLTGTTVTRWSCRRFHAAGANQRHRKVLPGVHSTHDILADRLQICLHSSA